MSPLALALVLVAALLHASWNFVAKQAGGGQPLHLPRGRVRRPAVGAGGDLGRHWRGRGFGLAEWAVLAASAVVHLLYFGYDMT